MGTGVPHHPNSEYWTARGHNRPIVRTVRDAALMLSVMAGPDPRDPLTVDSPPEDYVKACDGDIRGLRVAWSDDLGYALIDPEVETIAECAGQRFESVRRLQIYPVPSLVMPRLRGFSQGSVPSELIVRSGRVRGCGFAGPVGLEGRPRTG
jgi:hypothetical protein